MTSGSRALSAVGLGGDFKSPLVSSTFCGSGFFTAVFTVPVLALKDVLVGAVLAVEVIRLLARSLLCLSKVGREIFGIGARGAPFDLAADAAVVVVVRGVGRGAAARALMPAAGTLRTGAFTSPLARGFFSGALAVVGRVVVVVRGAGRGAAGTF